MTDMDDDPDHDGFDPDEPVVVPVTDTLDLHAFNPKEVADLLEEYIRACRELGIISVRIIHGKGKGVLKERVTRILEKHPHVLSYSSGHLESGGWGATRAELRPRNTQAVHTDHHR